jgi:glutamate-1-semialdehyde 2,1-aminomutase
MATLSRNDREVEMRSLKNSNAQFRKALTKLPLGVSSNFRYWGDDKTIYAKRGKGARIWDIDDNEYIDYRLGYGPAILGYADERVDRAAREGMDVGGVFALATEREYTVAGRISKMVPAAEKVRFSNSGTEAVMAALRLARAHSGRDSYVVVEGGYHGLFDAVLWYSSVEDWEPGKGEPELRPYGQGVPPLLKRLVHSVPMNDANRLEDVLKKHHNEIGSLLIEAILGNCCSIAANRQYVQDVRVLCDRYDVVMIMDEVKTGFRVAKGGAQSLYGVTPDLCTFAKAIANGYPISVLAGRSEIMDRVGKGVAHGGTYTAHSVSMAAAEATLTILDETSALDEIAAYGAALQSGISAILKPRGIAHSFVGHPSMGGLFFADTPPQNYRDWKKSDYTFYDTMAQFLHDLGVLCEPDSREPWFVSAAHDQTCLRATLKAFETAVEQTLDALPDKRSRA